MKTVRQARQEAYEELQKPEYRDFRNLLLQDIIETAKEIIQNWEKENEQEN